MVDASAADEVVAGIVLISSIRAQALFDIATSHSFVSRAFAPLYGLEVEPLPHA